MTNVLANNEDECGYFVDAKIVNLSDLSAIDKRLFDWAWTDYRSGFVKEFVESNLVEISALWRERRNAGIFGVIRLSAKFPSDLKNGEWRYSFMSYAEWGATHELEDAAAKDPFTMGVVFTESHNQTYYFEECPKHVITDLPRSLLLIFKVANHQNTAIKAVKALKQPEQKLEDGLYDWLRVKGVDVERQVTTAKHRLDLWIPNKAMLELKQGRVSGDDVCQAIDYAATYQMPIVLVGTGLSSSGSRGIDGFNRAMGKDLIIFVTWGGIRAYLSGILSL
jgi:hypothetical protein